MNYEIKADKGKPKLSLVPPQIIEDIAVIREYGVNKYGSSEDWKKVEPNRWIDAGYRHWLKFIKDPMGVDEESGYPHLWHVATNIAMLCEIMHKDLMSEDDDDDEEDILDLIFEFGKDKILKVHEHYSARNMYGKVSCADCPYGSEALCECIFVKQLTKEGV